MTISTTKKKEVIRENVSASHRGTALEPSLIGAHYVKKFSSATLPRETLNVSMTCLYQPLPVSSIVDDLEDPVPNTFHRLRSHIVSAITCSFRTTLQSRCKDRAAAGLSLED